MHIDAASAGFVAPFLHPDPKWDFRLPLVKSIFELVGDGSAIPVFAFKLKDEIEIYSVFDVSDKLRESGWPACQGPWCRGRRYILSSAAITVSRFSSAT